MINRLKEIENENIIWLIYLGIILLSYYANSIEKDYILNGNEQSKEKYRKIMIFIFSILVIIYLYFLYDSYKSLDDSNLSKLSFIASLLIFTSGIIFLYIAYKDKELNVELAFN